MDYDKTVHVDHLHSKVCFCAHKCTDVTVTKSGHVEKGDSFVNKHISDCFQKNYKHVQYQFI